MRWTRHPVLVTLFISLLAANWLLATELPFRGIAYTSYQTGEYPVTTSWIPENSGDSQGLTATTVTTENSHRGRGSLRIDFDINAQHPDRSKGEVYVDMRDKPPLFSPSSCWYAPFDLLQQRVTVMAYITSEMLNDDIEHPNGVQIFFKSADDDDNNWGSFYGAWHNITIADVGTWKEISATPSTTKPPGGYIHPQFDPKRIVSVGVKFGTGDESNFNNSGSFFIDDLDWPGGVDPEYGFENVDDSLATLVAANANDASVLVTWYMETLTSNEIAPHPNRTHSDEEIRELIDMLHGLGINVMLKPHVNVLDDDDDDDDDTWRGLIQPGDVDQWFDAYTAFITHYAEMAAELNVELFCVGTEFESLSDSEFIDYWRNVIADVAAIYDGELTYAANWDGYAQASYLVKRNPDLLK
ncbi:MAG: hypothetical protein GY835_08740, partial [bacterium]|nr:hypothetical protein [bacterium]